MVFLLSLRKGKIRASMLSVVRAFFVRPILLGVLLLAGYIAGSTYLLAYLQVWTPIELKLTILWFGSVGIVGLFSCPEIARNPDLFAKYARDSFKLTLLLEFYVNLFKMPLVLELVFVPFLVLIGALLALSESKEEFATVKKFLNQVFVFIGLVFTAYAVWKTATDFETVATLETLRSFALPVIYSLLVLPFLWVVAAFIAYQNIFVRLEFLVEDESIISFTKKTLVFRFRGNIRYLRAWFNNTRLNKIENEEDVRESIQKISRGKASE